MRLKFDVEKAIETIIYIAGHAPHPDIYHVLKIMYFADKEHLSKYGRFICNDTYIAMNNGPVPSGAYDIIKHVRGDGYHPCVDQHAENSFEVRKRPDYKIIPLRNFDSDLLSESDIECLNKAITQYGSLTFDRLKELSHDGAFNSADENDEISIEAIAATLEDGDLLVNYLRTY